MAATRDSVEIGAGGDGAALAIDRQLLHGTSYRSDTFDNETLSSEPQFKVMHAEVWGLGWKPLRFEAQKSTVFADTSVDESC